MKITKQDHDESLAKLRKGLSPRDSVYTCLRNVSRSGMSRRITVHVVHDGELLDITWHVHNVTGFSMRDGQLIVNGCGMDMGFHVVYTLGRYLFPDGFAQHGRGRNGDASGWDNDGGYALNHRWL